MKVLLLRKAELVRLCRLPSLLPYQYQHQKADDRLKADKKVCRLPKRQIEYNICREMLQVVHILKFHENSYWRSLSTLVFLKYRNLPDTVHRFVIKYWRVLYHDERFGGNEDVL